MNSPVKNKQSLVNLILSNKERIRGFGVQRLGIFGSFVRNEARETSDVDFYVEFIPGKKKFDNFMELGFFLEELTGRKIELITPQSLSPYIGPHILKQVEYVPIAA